jgi:hypothetical protein
LILDDETNVAATVAIRAYQIVTNDLAALSLARKRALLATPLLIAKNGKTAAPIGKYENELGINDGASANLNGTRCAPSQSQSAALIASVVFPLALPAVAQATSEIKLIGNKVKTMLRSAC